MRNGARNWLVLGLLATAVGCHGGHGAFSQQAVWESKDGLRDLILPIARLSRESDGGYSVVASGVLEGQRVGLAVRFHPQGVTFFADGAQTLGLVAALGKAYGVTLSGVELRPAVELTSLVLQGDPRRPKDGELRLKVFHDEKEERGEYYELYVNLDLDQMRLVLKEKDPEYRENILKGFGGTVLARLGA